MNHLTRQAAKHAGSCSPTVASSYTTVSLNGSPLPVQQPRRQQLPPGYRVVHVFPAAHRVCQEKQNSQSQDAPSRGPDASPFLQRPASNFIPDTSPPPRGRSSVETASEKLLSRHCRNCPAGAGRLCALPHWCMRAAEQYRPYPVTSPHPATAITTITNRFSVRGQREGAELTTELLLHQCRRSGR